MPLRDHQPLTDYCNICNPFEYEANYPAMVGDHMRDVTDLFTDLVMAPSGGFLCEARRIRWTAIRVFEWILLEDFAQNIIDLAQSNPEHGRDRDLRDRGSGRGGFYDRL